MNGLTPKQIADISYNDRQVKNYKWNLKQKIEEEEQARIEIEAYKKRMSEYKPEHKMRPHDFYIAGNRVINEEREVEAGFTFNK